MAQGQNPSEVRLVWVVRLGFWFELGLAPSNAC